MSNPVAITTEALAGVPNTAPRKRGRPPRQNTGRPEQRLDQHDGVMAESVSRPEQRDDQRLTLPVETEGAELFNLDMRRKPEGMTYQGIAYSIFGKINRQRLITAERYHWKIVPRDRHPECATEDPDEKMILLKGTLLMERPTYLDNQAKMREKDNARGQLTNQMERLKLSPTGIQDKRMPGIVKVNSSYQPAPGEGSAED